MAGTFISYRREDTAGYAGRLRESLERRLGLHRVFRDVDALLPGQDFVTAIETRLASCRVTLVVIGREWLEARNAAGTRRLDEPYDFVRLEVAAALAQKDVLVVPVLVEGASMPGPADLPDNIRLLARRHAVSVRDETWDADVDRLVGVIDGAESPAASPTRHTPTIGPRRWIVSGAALALIVLAAFAFVRTRTGDPRSGGAEPSSTSPSGQAVSAYAIDVPRVAEAAFGDLIYTLVSGNVAPRPPNNELRLRLRLSNDSEYDANFWDRSFRLVVDGQTTMPTSDLNDLVPGHSLRYGIVRFPLARGAGRIVLQILNDAAPVGAEIRLDATPTGRAAIDEQAPVADSLSQAIVRPGGGQQYAAARRQQRQRDCGSCDEPPVCQRLAADRSGPPRQPRPNAHTQRRTAAADCLR